MERDQNENNKGTLENDERVARNLQRIRVNLIRKVDDNRIDLSQFMEAAISFWMEHLGVDRVFVCDARDGRVVAGWNSGKNIVKTQDWDPRYIPLEDDQTLQAAIEGEDLVANPVPGEGVDLAFTLPLDDGQVWVVALDQTDQARVFSDLDLAYIALVRDLAVIKSRLKTTN